MDSLRGDEHYPVDECMHKQRQRGENQRGDDVVSYHVVDEHSAHETDYSQQNGVYALGAACHIEYYASEQTKEHARSLALKHRDADHHDRHCELMRAERLRQKSRRILDNGAENQQHCENHAADYKSFLFGCETHRQVPFDRFVTL